MLNLSNEVFNALSRYLSGDESIEKFRDFMVGLRVDRYKLLPAVDRLFLNEFEGRYAEFSDFGNNEDLLKASLALYVQADDASAAPSHVGFWFLPSAKPSAVFSISAGSLQLSGNFSAACSQLEHSTV